MSRSERFLIMREKYKKRYFFVYVVIPVLFGVGTSIMGYNVADPNETLATCLIFIIGNATTIFMNGVVTEYKELPK